MDKIEQDKIMCEFLAVDEMLVWTPWETMFAEVAQRIMALEKHNEPDPPWLASLKCELEGGFGVIVEKE